MSWMTEIGADLCPIHPLLLQWEARASEQTTKEELPMNRAVTLAAALAAIAMLATASAAANPDNPAKLAAKQCQGERQADGAAFRATYGRNATRDCIRANRGEVRQDTQNAAQECRAERDADPDAFRETYGTNKDGRNAFGRCVSSKVRAEIEEEVEAFKNAAKDCRAERDADPDTFRETYGTNQGNAKGAKRNAFGKCVSSKVEDTEEVEPTDE
jgi:hypothetical protein